MNKIFIRNITLSIVLLFILSCQKTERKNMIYGRIKNAEKSWIFLQKISEEGYTTIDSVESSDDGSFAIKNPAKSPDYYVLRADATNIIYLVLRENETVEVNGSAANFESNYEVKGSKDSQLLKELRAFEKKLNDSLSQNYESLRGQFPEKKDSIGQQLQIAYSMEIENYSKEFIKNNMQSIVSLSATKFINQYSEMNLLNTLKDSLKKAFPDNVYVKDYELLLTELNNMPAGSLCPDITMNSPEGKSISLSSYRGKVVLIDFWASWCSPCRRENPALVGIYERLKRNDFEIFGVSLDENIAAWKNAIEKDKITWPQVSDLKRWESKLVKEFHIESIPYNILIDREGKIIAKGIRSDEIEIKVNEAMKGKS